MAEMIFQNCTVYITIADPTDLKISQETRAITTKAGETSIIIQKQEKAPATAMAATQDKPWITTGEATHLFGLSSTFFLSLSKRAPALIKKDGYMTIFNRDLVKKWIDEHPEVYASGKRYDSNALVQQALGILKHDLRKLRGGDIPGSRHAEYYTAREMAKKLNIAVGTFLEIKPLLIQKLVTDEEYLSLIKDPVDVALAEKKNIPMDEVKQGTEKPNVLTPAEIIKADPAHVELVDIKCVVDKTLLTRETLTNDNEWLSCTEAAREFKFSDAFFWYLSKTVPGLKKPDSIHCLLNRAALKRYFKEHPEHRATQSRKYFDLEGSVQKAMDILKQDRKEMYPDSTVPRSIKNNYYTYGQMAKKLDVSYSYFQMRIKPILRERLKNDASYAKLVSDARADEKKSIDSMVERCIELIDHEGRPFRSYQGMLPDPGNYMSAKELAKRMEIPYAFFNQKIKPHLEGKTDDRDAVKFDGEINEWKKTAELSV